MMAILQVDLEIIERFTRTRVVKLLHVEINKWDVLGPDLFIVLKDPPCQGNPNT
jgi:hypothetical protein